jgi:hypothetical protein
LSLEEQAKLSEAVQRRATEYFEMYTDPQVVTITDARGCHNPVEATVRNTFQRLPLYFVFFVSPRIPPRLRPRLSPCKASSQLYSRGFALLPHESEIPMFSLRNMSEAQSATYYNELKAVGEMQLLPPGIDLISTRVHSFVSSHV